MATKKTIEIDLNISEAQKALNKFGGTLEDVYEEGAQPLNFAIGELEDRLYEMAAAGDTSSKQFKEMSAEVGKMKKVIIDVDMAVDGMSQTLSQNVGGALSGVAGGFELAQGAMGAFGASGEKVEEALLKVQSAMAISQGIQGIRESIASFKALRKSVMANVVVQKLLNFVMNMNPIGKIILAVTALGAAIAFLWKPIQKLGDFFEGITKKLGAFGQLMKWTLAVVFAPFIIAVKGAMAILKSLGLVESDEAKAGKARHAKRMTQINERIKKEKELRDKLKKEYEAEQENLDRLIKLGEAQGKSTEALTKQKIQGSIDYQKEQLKEIENTIKATEYVASKTTGIFKEAWDEKLAKEKESLKASQDAIKDAELELEIIDIKAKQKGVDRAKAASDKKREIEAKNAEEKLKAEQTAEAEKQSWLDQIAQAEEDAQTTAQQKELNAVSDKYFQLIEKAKEYNQNTQVLEDEQQRALQAINDKYQAEEDKKNQEIKANAWKQTLQDAADREALEKSVRDSKVQIARDGLQLVSDLAGMFADRSEKAARIAFNIQKAASIAQATISGIEATINAFKTASASPVTTVFPAFPFIQAGLAGAFAAANIAKISSSKFQGGGGGGGGAVGVSGSAGSIGGGGGSSPAQFNVVGNTGVNQLAESLGGQDNVVKSYVVSGDVTTAQSLDRNRIDTASI